jgi:hypothetical protein
VFSFSWLSYRYACNSVPKIKQRNYFFLQGTLLWRQRNDETYIKCGFTYIAKDAILSVLSV